MTRRRTPGETEALAGFAQQLERIKHHFADVDRLDERFTLYGVETPHNGRISVSIDEWGTLLGAIKARLRQAVGQTQSPGFNDTPASLQASVLGCVDALDQLHVMLGDALSEQTLGRRDISNSADAGKRRGAAQTHVSGVPVSSSPLLNCARAAVAND